jgi:hypothetical protein
MVRAPRSHRLEPRDNSPRPARHVDDRSRRKFGDIETLRDAARACSGILDRAVVPPGLSHHQNESAMLLSKRVSFFRGRKRGRLGCERRAMDAKSRAQMELQNLKRDRSCAVRGERYDLLGQWYDLQARVLTTKRGAINLPA